jgi:bla regulator protein blaR1
MNQVFNHLWQSTMFAAAVALACAALRRNSPRLRYWLWLAASLKFLLPFSLLVSTGAKVQMPPDTPSLHAVTVQQISTYFAPVSAPARTTFQWPLMIAAVWLAGSLFLLVRCFRSWRRMNVAVREGRTLEPGVFGLFRPVLLLPEGLADSLTEDQLQAVLVHESRHIECYDNLTAALHMIVETIFWFYPLVWWIGARLMDERERDCDEAVLRQGSQPGAYARSIVQVCEAYVESPLACASGISGSDLKKRIREIMTWRGSLPITLRAKMMLAVATLAAVTTPFVIGILRAQTLPPPPSYGYGVVSIRPAAPDQTQTGFGRGPQGGLRTMNTSVMMMVTFAYSVADYQIVGAPGWVSSEPYDVTLTPEQADVALGPESNLKDVMASQDRNKQRLQAVLRDRFGLVLRAETHELPIYALVQAKSGAKLAVHPAGDPKASFYKNGPGHVEGTGATISMLTGMLSRDLGHPVNEESGLGGQYDFKLDWTPDSDTSGTGPSIFTALTDQLGLRLESKKGPVLVYVIEKVERPSEN